VLKADAYGLGAAEVAQALGKAGCRRFFVAHLGEALALRNIVPSKSRIFVLNGVLEGEEQGYAADNIVPVLNDPGQVQRWSRHAGKVGRSLLAAIHVDTGMSRLGMTPAEATALATSRKSMEGVALAYVMSHLARAEEAVEMNREQLAALKALQARWPGIPASLANSSGIFLGEAWHLDLVRPGAALYGINPVPGKPNPQACVATLSASVLQVRDIAPAQTVGYGATWTARAPTRVATIAVGYADGWMRSLSNRGGAHYRGKLLPFIGRVSMDLVTLDASACPELAPGHRVELLGPNRPVDAVAAEAGTIGYEVLTSLGRRFARMYRPA
jgi:alanine racemase